MPSMWNFYVQLCVIHRYIRYRAETCTEHPLMVNSYFSYLTNRIFVQFQPKFPKAGEDQVHQLEMSKKSTYDQVMYAVVAIVVKGVNFIGT